MPTDSTLALTLLDAALDPDLHDFLDAHPAELAVHLTEHEEVTLERAADLIAALTGLHRWTRQRHPHLTAAELTPAHHTAYLTALAADGADTHTLKTIRDAIDALTRYQRHAASGRRPHRHDN